MSKNYQIELDQAIDWTKDFRSSAPGKMDGAKAFLIPVEDLVGMLVEMNILVKKAGNLYSLDEGNGNDVRAYLAVDPKQESASGQKLVMVGTKKLPIEGTDPVQYVHKDIINRKIDNEGPIITVDPNRFRATEDDPGPDTGIYDFTQPCPDYCDPKSPLI